MLVRLDIHSLAVIEALELEFSPGMTALTGETGAGKSILVDALALALGERADSRAIRSGADRCTVTAAFDLGTRADVAAWLVEQDLDADGECILRRIVTTDGRSRGYINGHSVPMQTLRAVGERLVDICGQQAHQSLRFRQVQRAMLDGFGGHDSLLRRMSNTHASWQLLRDEFDGLAAARQDREARRELLTYQVAELTALGLTNEELADIERDHARAANAGHITTALTDAIERLFEADSGTAHAAIAAARRDLVELQAFDDELAPLAEMLGEAEILITETTQALRRHAERIEHDPGLLQRLDRRLGDIHELARKHRIAPDKLPDLTTRLGAELALLEASDGRLDALESELAAATQAMQKAATALTHARGKAAKALETRVTGHMQELGMTGGRFEVHCTTNGPEKITSDGVDRIEFRVAINPGQAAGPLAKVASGGELSRISLALQVVAIANNAIPTLIFDEVDAGIGGGVAEIVGMRLRELAGERQVLCVTHLPQVASQADAHLRVVKLSDGKSTQTTVTRLTQDERVEEIARMLGGIKITARTRDHATEMLGAVHKKKSGNKR